MKKSYLSLILVALFAVASIGRADTYDLTVGGTTELPNFAKGGSYVIDATVNFATTSYSSGDVLQLFDIPAGVLVERVGYEVETAEGGTLTFDIGDGSDPDGYIDGANGNSATYGISDRAITLTTSTTALGTNVTVTTTNITYDSDGAGTMLTNTVVTGVSLDTANIATPSAAAPTAYRDGQLYTAADTIDMTINNDADAAKITVRVWCVPVYQP